MPQNTCYHTASSHPALWADVRYTSLGLVASCHYSKSYVPHGKMLAHDFNMTLIEQHTRLAWISKPTCHGKGI